MTSFLAFLVVGCVFLLLLILLVECVSDMYHERNMVFVRELSSEADLPQDPGLPPPEEESGFAEALAELEKEQSATYTSIVTKPKPIKRKKRKKKKRADPAPSVPPGIAVVRIPPRKPRRKK